MKQTWIVAEKTQSGGSYVVYRCSTEHQAKYIVKTSIQPRHYFGPVELSKQNAPGSVVWRKQ